jgi:hypothetical protein
MLPSVATLEGHNPYLGPEAVDGVHLIGIVGLEHAQDRVDSLLVGVHLPWYSAVQIQETKKVVVSVVSLTNLL